MKKQVNVEFFVRHFIVCIALMYLGLVPFNLDASSLTPQILFSPQPVYFGQIPQGSSATREVLVYNMGSSDANISDVSIKGEHSSFFTLKTIISSSVLEPLEVLVLEIEFSPTAMGERTAELVLESNSPSSPDKVTLTASATASGSSILTFERIIGTPEANGGNAIKQTADGGYIIVGNTVFLDEDYSDIFIVKTDVYGRVEWMNNHGGKKDESASDVYCTEDNGYIIIGTTTSYGAGREDIYLIKLDAVGEKQWQKTYGGIFDDRASCFKKTNDHGYIIAGATKNTTDQSRNALLVKIDAAGEEQWFRDYGGDGGETASDVLVTDDNRFLVLGSTTSIGAGEFDVWLFKTDAQGDVSWEKTYGGTDWEEGNSIQPIPGGGYIIGGYTVSKGSGARDMYFINIDASGNVRWEETYGDQHNDIANKVLVTDDGGFLFGGYTTNIVTDEQSYTDILIVRTNNSGAVEWTTTFGDRKNENVSDILPMDDGGFIMVGTTGSYSKANDIYLIRFSDKGKLIPVEKSDDNIPHDFYLSQNYPNPFNNTTCIQYYLPVRSHVSIHIYTLLGQQVATLIDEDQQPGSHQVIWDAGTMASGLYLYELTTDHYSFSRRMLLLK